MSKPSRDAGEVMIEVADRIGLSFESLGPITDDLMAEAAHHRRAGRLDDAAVSERAADTLCKALERHRPVGATLH